MGAYQAVSLLQYLNVESCSFAFDGVRLDQPPADFFSGVFFDWRSRRVYDATTGSLLRVGYGWLCVVGFQSRNRGTFVFGSTRDN